MQIKRSVHQREYKWYNTEFIWKDETYLTISFHECISEPINDKISKTYNGKSNKEHSPRYKYSPKWDNVKIDLVFFLQACVKFTNFSKALVYIYIHMYNRYMLMVVNGVTNIALKWSWRLLSSGLVSHWGSHTNLAPQTGIQARFTAYGLLGHVFFQRELIGNRVDKSPLLPRVILM